MAKSALWVAIGCLSLIPARADVGLIMNESTGKGVSQLTSAGHSAIYLSDICPDSPVKLRLCRPGEQGSILSNYTNFGEVSSYEWNIVPVSIFLYGVEDSADAPLYGNEDSLKLLQERYRETHLSSLCPAETCGNLAVSAHWRDMVGGTFVRQIYLFRAKTTTAEDARLVEQFNALPNENHYNGLTRNCADFARSVINRYFSDAAKPDHLNDFGMTSPKAISKSFTRYSEKRPELQFTAERFEQLPGPMRRSSPCRKGTEVSFRMKKWFIPLMVARSHELPFFVAAYALTGRFNPDHEVKVHQSEEEATADVDWKAYQSQFREILDTALNDGVFSSDSEVRDYFRILDRTGLPQLDQGGLPVLEVGGRTVGLSRGNLLGAGSDPLLAYQLILARVQAVLEAPVARREDDASLKRDWDLLLRTRERMNSTGN
jgi:hypothetical protein